MLRSSGRRFQSPRLLQEKLDHAKRLMTDLVRLQSPATALILLRFCPCWYQISYHAPTMPPVSLHLCTQRMQTSLKTCLGEGEGGNHPSQPPPSSSSVIVSVGVRSATTLGCRPPGKNQAGPNHPGVLAPRSRVRQECSGSFPPKREACSNPAQGLIAFHIGPVMVRPLCPPSHTKARSDDDLHPEPLAEFENLKRSFHDTANWCHQNGLRFIPAVSDAQAGRLWRLSTQLGHLDLPPTQHHLSLHNDRELAQRTSSSLHRDSARAILRRVRLAAPRDAPMPLGPDDWWPAWDDPDLGALSTDFDSLAEMSDDDSLTTKVTLT